MKKRSEKQQDLDKLKSELAKVSTVILSTFQASRSKTTPSSAAPCRRGRQIQGCEKHARGARRCGHPAENLLKNLSGTNSIAYTATDPVALAKALTKVAKDVPAFQFNSAFEARFASC